MPKVIQRVSGRTQGKLRFVLKKKKKGSERESRGNEPTWESPGFVLGVCLLTQTHHGRCRSYSSQTTPSAFLPTASGDS